MRALYYNCDFGISGLMNVSAILDLGMPFDYLLAELAKLNISGYRLEMLKVDRHGLIGTELKLILQDGVDNEDGVVEDSLSEKNRLERRKETPEFLESLAKKKRKLFSFQNKYYLRKHYSAMRKHVEDSLSKKAMKEKQAKLSKDASLLGGVSYSDILDIIAKSLISDKAKEISLNIFNKLCEAEAQVQAKAKEELIFKESEFIHFLVDIVASAIALDYFKVDKVYATSLNIGAGNIGKYPISIAGANLLLKGLPCVLSGLKLDSTAVGVGILLATVDGFNEELSAGILSQGYGFGSMGRYSLGVSLLDLKDGAVSAYNKEEIVELSANVDEMSAKDFEVLRQNLLSLGALDIWQEPIFRGAKEASKLCLISNLAKEDKLLEALKIANIRELRRVLKTRYILLGK